MNEMMKSRGFKMAAIAVAFISVALVSFVGGVKVGSHRALFSARWGENYAKNFMGERLPMDRSGFFGGMMHNPEGNDFRNANGLAGTIISVATDKLIIKDRDGKENTVAVTDKTIIKGQANDLKISDLKANDKVVVMGRPSADGTVSADLIRVFGNLPPADPASNNQPTQNNNQ
jgi:hypothetical protein